jgi:hypothetical protein
MTNPMLLTSPRITDDSIALMQAAQQRGWEARRLPNYRPGEELRDKRIVLYGEPLFGMIVASKLGYALLEPTYDWLTTLPTHYVQRHIQHTTLGAARHLKFPLFVKNADGLKGFDARVYATAADLPSPEFYSEDYPVLVSEPVHWQVEYRCFVLERQVQTLSVYLRDGQLARAADGNWQQSPAELAQAHAFCQACVADSDVKLPPALVVDVGQIEGRGWAVIEANPVYGSGIYGCDPQAVLDVLTRACVPMDELPETDAVWTMPIEVED